MTVLHHLGRHGAQESHPAPRGDDAAAPDADPRVYAVQRLGAVAVGGTLLVFGAWGATTGVPFLDIAGEDVLGMSVNGLLSLLSLVVGAGLLAAAWRGPRVASTVMITLGVLFLLSALGNLAVLRTGLNLLAFQMSNVVFSVVVGLVLLVLGAYGRVSGNLPPDSPYAHPHPDPDEPPDLPETPAEVAAESAMRAAEIAVVEHRATEDQRRRVAAMAQVHRRYDRRRVWTTFDRPAGDPPRR
ncbi:MULTISPECIES: DUF4383 domain-containing protein [unclassified Blastococcus]